MADYTDVQNSLVTLAANAIYPNGTGQASVTGFGTYVYAGWPNAQQLNSDLTALNAGTGGRIHVSVFATNIERDVSRYFPWQTAISTPQATLVITVTGSQVVIGGTVSAGQSVVVTIAGAAYIYTVQAGDTLASISSGVAALIPGATSTGNTLSSGLFGAMIPGAASIMATASSVTFARPGAVGTVLTEYGRVARVFRTTVWAHTPAARAATAIAIDRSFRQAPFITLADATQARMKYRASGQDDVTQRDDVYRRDIDYEVEFALTVATTVPIVTGFGVQTTTSGNAAPFTLYE